MNKHTLGVILLSIGLSSSATLAAQNVANTSQKGSLLIYPAVDVDPEDRASTLIEISNDENSPIQVECYYVNEKKGRVAFDFELTAKQAASWDVSSGTGTISAPPFPSGGTFTPGSPNRGELVCFAVDSGSANQVAFNHLTGDATAVHFNTDAGQAKHAFSYNAWAFTAEGAPPDYTVIGTPGRLDLSGGGLGTYDACPQYNIGTFMPGKGDNGGAGSRLGVPPASLYTSQNALTVVSCNQDLRQDFVLHLTKLQFTVWNANGESFTGSYACVDSVAQLGGPEGSAVDVINGSNFTRPTLRTDNARFQVQGIASTQCAGSENAGILSVLESAVALGTDTTLSVPLFDQELGSTTQGAGFEPGFVLWDPAGAVPQSKVMGNRHLSPSQRRTSSASRKEFLSFAIPERPIRDAFGPPEHALRCHGLRRKLSARSPGGTASMARRSTSVRAYYFTVT
jgi:hypothetical protein